MVNCLWLLSILSNITTSAEKILNVQLIFVTNKITQYYHGNNYLFIYLLMLTQSTSSLLYFQYLFMKLVYDSFNFKIDMISFNLDNTKLKIINYLTSIINYKSYCFQKFNELITLIFNLKILTSRKVKLNLIFWNRGSKIYLCIYYYAYLIQ